MSDPAPAIAYLDTNVFIFLVEGLPSVSEPVKTLFKALQTHPGSGVTSELTLAEVMVSFGRRMSPPIKRAYLDLIVQRKFLDLSPVSREILLESAELRVAHREAHDKKLDLPDAIHLVTAIRKRCRYFVSADDGIRPPIEMTRIAPNTDDLVKLLNVLS